MSQTLTEASRVLRSQASFPDYTLEGFVVRLGSDAPGEGGTITITAEVEGRVRQVSVAVDGSDYEQAIEAHTAQDLVSLTGELAVEAGRYRLLRARDFRARRVD